MASVPPDPLLGQVLDDKYRILEKIGSGSMGTVYRARHVSLDAPRALKVMRRELADNAEFVQRFRREARMVESLRHPNLVSLYDFGCLDDGTWYIVSEFVEGETLAGRLRNQAPFAASDAALLLGQVADGLALAHRKGIVHRDISPDNIMITRGEDGTPVAKLVDFGVAKSIGDAALAGSAPSLLFGKAGYASPEQVGLLPKGDHLDPRADVFSLSAVAFEMLTGRLPWRKDSLQSYVHDLLVRPESETRAAIEALTPPPWRSVLARGLARDRSQRTPSATILKTEMLEAVGLVRPRRVVVPDSRRTAAALAIGLGLAALIGLGVTLAPWRPSSPAPGASVAPASLAKALRRLVLKGHGHIESLDEDP